MCSCSNSKKLAIRMFFIMHGENGKFIHSSNADVYFFAPRSKLGSKIKI